LPNGPYASGGGHAPDSPIKGKFDATTLPKGDAAGDTPAATLGGWNLAVSKYSKNPDAAIDLVKFLANADMQKLRAIEGTNLPTRSAVYDDPDVVSKVPIVAHWKDVVLNAVPRPSAPNKVKYNEVSSDFWTAVHNTLAGQGSAADNLATLEVQLTKLKGAGW
jgi:trehalose/maltose transport system substrate-binding protein